MSRPAEAPARSFVAAPARGVMAAPAAKFMAPEALYVHVPFCASRCAYCDFFSCAGISPGSERMERYVRATLCGIEAMLRRFCPQGPHFDTIYIGGGTPSRLGPALLAALLQGIRNICLGPARDRSLSVREWTVEVNPESFNPAILDALVHAGVTRLSIGLQSMDAATLAFLGRPGSLADNEAALQLAADSGLALSADLMAALPLPALGPLPAPDSGRLAREAGSLVDAGFDHLSVYDLVPEQGTAIAAMLAAGTLDEADADLAAASRSSMEDALASKGLRRYEISNYARPGAESLHNSAYWAMRSYIGAGPGAVSTLRATKPRAGAATKLSAGAADCRYDSSLRIEQAKDIDAYIANPAHAGVETFIGPRDTIFESIMMAFRTSRGLDCADFTARFGLEPAAIIGATLRDWSEHLVVGEGGSDFIALDSPGMDIANRFLVDCLQELDTIQTLATTEEARKV